MAGAFWELKCKLQGLKNSLFNYSLEIIGTKWVIKPLFQIKITSPKPIPNMSFRECMVLPCAKIKVALLE